MYARPVRGQLWLPILGQPLCLLPWVWKVQDTYQQSRNLVLGSSGCTQVGNGVVKRLLDVHATLPLRIIPVSAITCLILKTKMTVSDEDHTELCVLVRS